MNLHFHGKKMLDLSIENASIMFLINIIENLYIIQNFNKCCSPFIVMYLQLQGPVILRPRPQFKTIM